MCSRFSRSAGSKQIASLFAPDASPLAIAPLTNTAEEEAAFSILTGAARPWMAHYHERQPALIAPPGFAGFLSPATSDKSRPKSRALPPTQKVLPTQGLLFDLHPEALRPEETA